MVALRISSDVTLKNIFDVSVADAATLSSILSNALLSMKEILINVDIFLEALHILNIGSDRVVNICNITCFDITSVEISRFNNDTYSE